MADKELSALTAATTPLDGTETHYVVQGGNSRKVEGNDIVGIPHTHAWASITSTPTTLSGYGITDAQPKDSDLTAIAALSPTSGAFIVGSGSSWTAESGAAARATLGLTIGTNVQAYSANLASFAGLGFVSGDIFYSTGANTVARLPKGANGQVLRLASGIPSWTTASGLGDLLATNNLSDLNSAATARTNLGLGSAALEDVTAFATSAQGATADSAVQPGDLAAVATTGDMDDMSDGASKVAMTVAERTKLSNATRTASTRTVLGGLDPTQNGAVRLTEDGFQGEFLPVDPAGYAALVAADTVGGEIKATANPNLSYLRQRQYGDYFKTSESGGNLGVALGLASLRHGKAVVEINDLGTKVLSAGLSVNAGISLVGAGSDRVTLDISGLASGVLVSNGIVTNGGLYVPGSGLISVAATRSAMNKGEKKVTFTSAHPFKAGDIMVMANPSDYSAGVWTGSVWTADTSVYKARQSFTVAAVEGLAVHTMEAAEFTFDTTGQNAANCYRQLPARGRYGGFTIDNTGNATDQVNPLMLAWLDGDTKVEDICVLGATYTGIRFEQCHNLRPRRLQSSTLVRSTFTAAPPSSSGNDYAGLLTSCYNVIVKESKFAGNWAGCDISVGGGAGGGTSINSSYEDCDISNTIALPAAGIHGGGTIKCGYHKSRIVGPAGYGGRSSSITDCSIYLGAGHPSNAFEAIMAQGIVSGTYDFSGTRIYSDKNAGGSGRACMDLNAGGGSDTYQTEEILYLGRKMEIVAPNETRPIVALNFNANYTASFDLDFAKAVVPSAGVFLVVSLKTGNPANIATQCKLAVTGLPAGCAYAAFSQNYKAAEMKFPEQTVDYTETPTAAASLITSVKTLNHAYPAGYPAAARWDLQDNAAGTKAQAKTYSVSTTTARGIIFTGDGTNLTAAATRVRMTVG